MGKENQGVHTIVFTKSLLHLKDIGIISENGEDLPSLFLSPFFLTCLIMKLGIIGNLCQDYDRESITVIFNNLVYLISLAFQASVAVMFHLHGKRTAGFVQRIKLYKYGISKNFIRLVRKLESETRTLYHIIVYGNMVFVLMNREAYQECSNMVKAEDTGLYQCGLYSRTWYPIPLNFFPVDQILLVFQVIEIVYFIPKVATALIFFQGIIILTEERIDDLKRFIKRTEVTDSNVEEVNKRLQFAAKKYIEITDTVKDMNSTIGFLFSPLQHAILLGLLVFLEFRVILERNMDSLLLLLFWSLFQFLICWRGQRLENASLSLQREVYEIAWYNLHPSSKSLFKIFYGHVQLTLKLKSPPFITMNMQYYYEIMKLSYSFLMFLHRF